MADKKHRAGRQAPRIIAGEWRGRKLPVPKGTSVRPTPDRVRETVFNWLSEYIRGAACLDLFAGTGALGLEALSRGAATVCFVERDPRLCRALQARLDGFGREADVRLQEAGTFLDSAKLDRFDIVFLDPPYTMPLEPLIERLKHTSSASALVYMERSAAEGLPEVPGLHWHKTATAGQVEFGLAKLV